jgi:transposase
LKAFLVFVDESGLLMAPLVRRSWAPRGKTPVLVQRTRSHQKVSVIAALCVSPFRDRLELYFRLHLDRNIRTPEVLAFLRVLLEQLDAPVIVVWDRLQAHRSKKVRDFVAACPTLRTVHLPPYAPELSPVEYLWCYLKLNPLANVAFFQIAELAQAARRAARSVQHNQLLLRSFLRHSPLSLRLR